MKIRRRRNMLRSDKRGAVLAEFAVVIMPLLMILFGVTQISMVYAAKLVVRHSAIAAVRAYAVIADPNPGDNGSVADATTAGQIAMGPWFTNGGKAITSATFNFASLANTAPPDGYYDLDTATVDAVYVCSVPMSIIWCQNGGPGQVKISYSASFPHQGARYKN